MIPICEPYLSGNELKYVTDCINTGWIAQGRYISKLEQGLARYCGCEYGISTTSGTTALHLALATLGVGSGDEVIIPTYTFISTAFAVIYTGAKPVLVDCEPETYNMDVTKIEEKITRNTRAIMPVHVYGHPCDMYPILKLAMEYNLHVVEDAAEAIGAEYAEHKVGSLSTIGCFSFHATKILTTGEGGMLVTSSKELADRARKLKDLATSPDRRYLHTDIAYNYRMTNVAAAIGLAQFESLDRNIERRRRHAEEYSYQLCNVKGITLPKEMPWARNVYWMYNILVDRSRDELMARLEGKQVETRPFFTPMHQQPCFEGMFKGKYPVAEDISNRGLYLPSGSGLRTQEIKYVCACVEETLNVKVAP